MRCLAEWPGDGVDLEHLHPFEGLVDIDLYSDQPQSAWNRVERTWPEIARSGLLRFTLFETFTTPHERSCSTSPPAARKPSTQPDSASRSMPERSLPGDRGKTREMLLRGTRTHGQPYDSLAVRGAALGRPFAGCRIREAEVGCRTFEDGIAGNPAGPNSSPEHTCRFHGSDRRRFYSGFRPMASKVSK